MKTAFVVILLILSIGLAKSTNNVVGGEDYIKRIISRMLALLKTETSISGGGLPMVDMVGNFSNMKSYELTLDGLVTYHSGFVMRIKSCEPLADYKDTVDSKEVSIKVGMLMKNVNVTFEVDSELEEYKGRSSIVIWIEGIQFFVEVKRNHETKWIEATVKFDNLFGSLLTKVHIFNFPSNPYTQLIGQMIKTANSSTYQQFRQSFEAWGTSLGKFARAATEEIKFPDICYINFC